THLLEQITQVERSQWCHWICRILADDATQSGQSSLLLPCGTSHIGQQHELLGGGVGQYPFEPAALRDFYERRFVIAVVRQLLPRGGSFSDDFSVFAVPDIACGRCWRVHSATTATRQCVTVVRCAQPNTGVGRGRRRRMMTALRRVRTRPVSSVRRVLADTRPAVAHPGPVIGGKLPLLR